MRATPTTIGEVQRRIRAVPRPRPILDRVRSERLTARQLQILDELAVLFADGFAHLTMADIAARLNCSLRTVYGIADSREALVLAAVDRMLWSVGRTAGAAVTIDSDAAPLEALRSYLAAANMAVSATTEAFARDLAEVPGGPELSAAHSDYLVAVARELLDHAVERGDIAPVDTAAVARTVAGLGRDFARPDVVNTIDGSPKEAADGLVDIILRGLAPS